MANIADKTLVKDIKNPERIEQMIECLGEFMLEGRLESLKSRLDLRTRYMVMCLEDIYYPHNASAVIRSCEAFGLQQIHAVENTLDFSPSRHIVRGTDQWVDLRKWNDTASLVEYLREAGYRIVVTSPREGGHTPDDFDIDAGKFALFMGTEKTGISEELMDLADDYIHIPMVGFAESLNISVSAAIITQRLTSRIRESAIDWKIPAGEHQGMLLEWMKRSVRDSCNILRHRGF